MSEAETVRREIPVQAAGLQLPAEPSGGRREGVFQRIGWLALFGFLAAGLLGLLGRGPLSRASAEAEGFSVEHQRIERFHAPAQLRVRARGQGDGRVRVWLGREFLQSVDVERIQPQPIAVELEPDRQVFVFEAPRLPLGERAEVVFFFQPETRFRSVQARAGVPGGPEVAFNQITLP